MRRLVVNPNTGRAMTATIRAAAEATGVPVVDPVWAGVTLVGALARGGARTSKRNRYRPVEPRPTLAVPSGLARVYKGVRRE